VVNSADTAIEATLAERKSHTGGGGPVNLLGISSVYHESAAALPVDGTPLAAAFLDILEAERRRINRRWDFLEEAGVKEGVQG
jgi:hypothetical protein